eukprot:TRINITY_DN19433_c0_g1::TRINITY_DN19433_c0_g1_i1::g.7774::m.7774 TRINITY_DN19433_c0_g1::TRINITY_DN19433_c0_g1_i1::g.7774  ORF type:complete len:284 (+),score=35.44,sp/P49592/NC2B_ARATH/44.03/6e-32,CBFD_NFYB_HMF/PF00808.18/1.5e-17,Histone/PF00125.19/0.00078,Bromo_TP/PF07524.8/0.2,PAT1/PF09770.4/5.8,FAM104/PF15434.1/0.23,FAM104/PF15434.1/8.6e+02 TRINITY_DN19433_c0_g1_i1:30-854(+)
MENFGDEDLGGGGVGGGEEVSLPRSTITKLIKDLLPSGLRCSNEARDLVTDCCMEYIKMLAFEANEYCGKENKKTIAPEHILQALRKLGYTNYLEEVQKVYEGHKEESQERPSKKKQKGTAASAAEMEAEQNALFESARAQVGVHNPMQSQMPQMNMYMSMPSQMNMSHQMNMSPQMNMPSQMSQMNMPAQMNMGHMQQQMSQMQQQMSQMQNYPGGGGYYPPGYGYQQQQQPSSMNMNMNPQMFNMNMNQSQMNQSPNYPPNYPSQDNSNRYS